MNKEFTLAQIAEFLQAQLRGDPDYIVTDIKSLDKAKEQHISFFGKVIGFSSKMGEFLADTKAGAVILSKKDAENYSGNTLIVDNPYLSYAKLTSLFVAIPKPSVGIHHRAVIGENCKIDETISVGANCVIGNDVIIGKNTVIEAGSVIGDGVVIGDDSHLYPNVTIYYKVSIGSRVILHSGVVIGADGFGMANEDGSWVKIHQLGSVKIGNDVEIGANTCVDRGAIEDTVIENGVKLDNQVQVGHNVRIGAHTIIAGCSGIAGSTTFGEHCMIGGAVDVNGHISLADKTVITGGSRVFYTIEEPGAIYSSSFPAMPRRKWLRVLSKLYKLHELVIRVRKLEEKQRG